MVASYEEFATQHRADHLVPFNRWCAVVANYGVPVAALVAIFGRPKAGAVLFALANAALIAGHVVEGNLPRNAGYFVRYPIWSVRADVAVANETVMGLVRRK
jgi:hypothetical protein